MTPEHARIDTINVSRPEHARDFTSGFSSVFYDLKSGWKCCRFRNSEKGIVFLSEKQRFLPRRAKRNENNLYNCIFGQKSPPKGAKFFGMVF